MQLKIENLVAGVMEAIESRGYARNTLETYRYSYNSIVRWFNEKNNGVYTFEMSQKYLSERQELLHRKKITPDFYQHAKRYLNFIQEYAETGVARLSYEYGRKIYQPSHESMTIVESILSTNPVPEKSKSKFRTLMHRFFCFIESDGIVVRDITLEVMLDFINHVHSCGASNTTMHKVLQTLKILAGYFTEAGVLKTKPDFSCFVPKPGRKRIISAFSMDETSKLLASFDRDTTIGKRNYAIVLLACGSGLRASDISSLKPKDINWKSGEVNIIQEKTQKPLKIVLSGQIRNAIADYILNGKPESDSDVIFLTARAPHTPLRSAGFSGIIDRACTAVNIPKKSRRSFHSLRRSFGTWMAKEEVSPYTISQMLGQKDMDASVPYLSFDDKQILSCAMGLDDVPLKGGAYK